MIISKNEMCLYCAKWYPKEEMRMLLGDYFCKRCYPDVYDNVSTLPWNKGKPPSEWK